MKRLLILTVVLLALTSVFFTGCTKNSTVGTKGNSEVYVEFDGGTITKADFNERVNALPEQQQESLNMSGRQVEFLELLAKEQAFYKKAIQLGYDKDPEVLKIIEEKLKQHYLNGYYEKMIRSKINITDKDVREYYDDNIDTFAEAPIASIRYIQTSTIEEANKTLADLAKGIPYETVATVKNINTYAKSNNNIISNIRNNGYIAGIGTDTELDSLIFSYPADKDKFYGPIKTTTGIHIFSVISKKDGYTKSFEEVEADARMKTKPAKEREMNNLYMEKIKKRLSIKIDEEVLNRVNFTDLASNDSILTEVVLSSRKADFDWTVEKLLNNFKGISKQEQGFVAQMPQAEVLDHILSKEIYYYMLKKEKYDLELNKEPKFARSRTTILLTYAYKQLVTDSLTVTEQDIEEYYDRNKDKFSKPSYRDVEILTFASEKVARKALKKYLQAVKKDDTSKIKKIMKDYALNSFDKRISNKTFNNGIVPNFGRDEILNNAIWNLPVNEVSDIVPVKRDNQVCFFRTININPIEYKPLNHVQPQIEGQLKRAAASARFDSLIDAYFKEFHFVIHKNRLKPDTDVKTIFELAEKQSKLGKHKDALLYYDQIIQNYKDGVNDYKATFMKGFTQSEYMKDKTGAIMTFTKFLKEFPEGDLNDDATFMLKELKGETPKFEIPND